MTSTFMKLHTEGGEKATNIHYLGICVVEDCRGVENEAQYCNQGALGRTRPVRTTMDFIRKLPPRLKAFFTTAVVNRWSAQITYEAMIAHAAGLLGFDCVATTITHRHLRLTSDLLVEGPLPFQLPAESLPARRRVGLGLVSVHIRNRRYANGTAHAWRLSNKIIGTNSRARKRARGAKKNPVSFLSGKLHVAHGT